MSHSKQKILLNKTNISLPQIHTGKSQSHSQHHSKPLPFYPSNKINTISHHSPHIKTSSNTRIPQVSSLNHSSILIDKETYKKSINRVAHLHHNRLQFYEDMLVDLKRKNQMIPDRKIQEVFNLGEKLRTGQDYQSLSKIKRKEGRAKGDWKVNGIWSKQEGGRRQKPRVSKTQENQQNQFSQGIPN